MKAAQIDDYGDASAIKVREVERVAASDGQVLIEVAAASLNPFDLAVLAGNAQSMAPLIFPATLGIDVAGTVIEVGSNVTGFAVGDRVYGTANVMFGASGSFAEYATAQAKSVARSPVNISDIEAATLPTAGISALQAINSMNLQTGSKVFIHGGSGGVGSLAVQIAKARGAFVAATASTDNVDYVTSLGADEVIDYKTQNYADIVKGFNALLNNVRGESTDQLLGALVHGGIAISLVGPFDKDVAQERDITAVAQLTHVNTAALDDLRVLVEKGAVKPVVERTFPLDNIRDAYISLANDSIKGKIAIEID